MTYSSADRAKIAKWWLAIVAEFLKMPLEVQQNHRAQIHAVTLQDQVHEILSGGPIGRGEIAYQLTDPLQARG